MNSAHKWVKHISCRVLHKKESTGQLDHQFIRVFLSHSRNTQYLTPDTPCFVVHFTAVFLALQCDHYTVCVLFLHCTSIVFDICSFVYFLKQLIFMCQL
jgi:hypothetical protein